MADIERDYCTVKTAFGICGCKATKRLTMDGETDTYCLLHANMLEAALVKFGILVEVADND